MSDLRQNVVEALIEALQEQPGWGGSIDFGPLADAVIEVFDDV